MSLLNPCGAAAFGRTVRLPIKIDPFRFRHKAGFLLLYRAIHLDNKGVTTIVS
jgi:hypothetical protein